MLWHLYPPIASPAPSVRSRPSPAPVHPRPLLPRLVPLPDVLPNSHRALPLGFREPSLCGHHQLRPGTEVSSHTRQPLPSKASLPLCLLLSPVLVSPGQRDVGGVPAPPYHIPRRHPGHPQDLRCLRPAGCSCGQQLTQPQCPAEVEEAPREWWVEGGPPRPPWATVISFCGGRLTVPSLHQETTGLCLDPDSWSQTSWF